MAVVRKAQHKKDLVLRLRRVEGQLRGIQSMIEAGAECEQIVQQLSASRRIRSTRLSASRTESVPFA